MGFLAAGSRGVFVTRFRPFAIVAVTGAVGLHSSLAGAFCRATTCNRDKTDCQIDAHGCATLGVPTWWADGRVTLSVDSAGSLLRRVSGDDLEAALEAAFDAWRSARCDDGGTPSITVEPLTIVTGHETGFDGAGPNENLVIFRDSNWRYEASAFAKTTIGMNLDTGEILDADTELNSQDYPLSMNPGPGDVDLVGVLTHEMGHFLGLAHSDVPTATMRAEASASVTTELARLDPDDVAGICAIYPPGAPPRAASDVRAPADGGGGGGGGCSVASRSGRGRAPVLAFAGVLVGCALGRRRSRRLAAAFTRGAPSEPSPG
jgi:hypothetical protein